MGAEAAKGTQYLNENLGIVERKIGDVNIGQSWGDNSR